MTGWPWPLDGIQQWFEGLWNGVLKWVNDAAGAINTFIWDKIIWVRDRISEGLTWTYNRIMEVGTWVKDRVQEGLNYVVDILNNTWVSASNWLTGMFNWVSERFWEGVYWIRDRANETASWINERIWEGVTWVRDRSNEAMQWVNDRFWDGVSWVGDRLSEGWTWVNTQLSTLGTTIITNFVRAFDDAASTILQGIINPLKDFVGHLWEGLIAVVTRIITKIQEYVIEPTMLVLKVIGANIAFVFRAAMEGLINIIIHPGHRTPEAAHSEMPSLILATALAGIGVAAVISGAQTKIAGSGMDLAPLANTLLPMIPSGLVASAYVGTAIQTGYITALRYYFNKLYTPLIPMSGDLIRFVVREAITPEDFTYYMAYQGFSEYWAEAYWKAHFLPAPLDRVYNAFHRGVIDEAYVRKMLFIQDYDPVYHDLLLSTIYTLIPRVDLRYGWETGALDDESLYAALRKHGFNDEDARAEMVIQKRRVLESELNTLRTETINDYVDGFITEDVLRANLAATLLRPELVDARVAAAKLKRVRAERKEQVTTYKTIYLSQNYTPSEAITDLKEIGLTQEEAVNTVKAWAVLKKPATTVKTKDPQDDVSAQLTLNERYQTVIEAVMNELAKKEVDVAETKFMLEDGKVWSTLAAAELKEGRVAVALDMARYAETSIKSAETSLRRASMKAQGIGVTA